MLTENKKKIHILILHFIILIGICLVPFFLSNYYLMLMIESILFGVFAMSLDLMIGYAGIASFGHAAFFGIGGYTLGVIIKYIIPSIWFALLISGFISGLCAFIIGIISIRTKGIYFAILTLAFAEVLYRLIFHTYNIWGNINLGGSDGLIGIPVPNLNFLFLRIPLNETINFYYFIIAFAYLSYLILHRIVNSPFGRVLQGVKVNEYRIPFLGFNVKKYKVITFIISGIFAGWSGALFALFKTFADTEQLHFLMSGKVIVMTLIGGIGTLIGPIVGALFVTVFETIISSYFEGYLIIVGFIFIIIVIFLPKGILGVFGVIFEKCKKG